MDLNKNKILTSNNYQGQKKEISLISSRNNNNNTNKIGLVININNQKGRYNKLYNSNDNQKNKAYINNKTINEITLNSLERENSLLKKEIEIVKSNLIISDKKELINKKTIKEIKRMNKEKENSYKKMINLINEYKSREIDFLNRIKQIENDSKKKEDELMNEISLYKQELIDKNVIIKELNDKIEELNERILSFKKIINEKNRILLFLTKKNKSQKFKRTNSINNILNARTMVSSKSCGNIIAKIIDFKSLNSSNRNNIRHNSRIGLKEILLNEENNNEKENKVIKIIKKQSYIKKRIPNNNSKIFYEQNNTQNNNILKKYYSNRNINEKNNNSLNYSNLNRNINMNSNKKKNTKNKNNIGEIIINKEKIGNINDNYSLILNDLEKHKNQIRALKELAKNKNINYCQTIGNKKSKPENMKGLYTQKNKLIEINKNLSNKNNNNSSYISIHSFPNIIPSINNK